MIPLQRHMRPNKGVPVLLSSEFITKKIGRDLFKYFNVTFAVCMSRLTNTAKSSSGYDLIYLHAELGTKTKYRKLKILTVLDSFRMKKF